MSADNPMEPGIISNEALRAVRPLRLSTSGAPPERESAQVVAEDVLVIDIKDVGCYSVLCTPGDSRALAVGFAFAEGIISSLADISILQHCDDDPGVIRMHLADPTRAEAPQRNLIVTSSCGMCGNPSATKALLSGGRTVGESLRVPPALLLDVIEQMRMHQQLFSQTGGSHAAALFSAEGEIIAFSEDIGRHNALDKAIGKCLLAGTPIVGCGVALSGRVSYELVAKSARAGVELIAAVSAPSSLAIETAQSCHITLCGFVREDRATVYTHPQRIISLED